MLIRPLLGRMMVIGTAIAVGSLAAPPTSISLGVDDGTCRRFSGTTTGNDPTQVMTLELCRDGDSVSGIKRSHGDAGHSAFHLRGAVNRRGVATLEIDGVQQVSTSEGWMTCTDDVFRFKWDSATNTLVGRYDSEACADHATMRLEPLDAERPNLNHCGMSPH